LPGLRVEYGPSGSKISPACHIDFTARISIFFKDEGDNTDQQYVCARIAAAAKMAPLVTEPTNKMH